MRFCGKLPPASTASSFSPRQSSPSASTHPAAYLFLIGVHRGGIGQSSSFQDTIGDTTLWEASAVEWTGWSRGGGRRDWQLATGPAACRLLSSGGCVHTRAYYGYEEDFLKQRRIFPHSSRGTGNSERTPNIPKTIKKT